MPYKLKYTNEFDSWFDDLSARTQDDVSRRIDMLAEQGPLLPYPYCSGIRDSRHGRMRELRIQSGGRPIRDGEVIGARVAIDLDGDHWRTIAQPGGSLCNWLHIRVCERRYAVFSGITDQNLVEVDNAVAEIGRPIDRPQIGGIAACLILRLVASIAKNPEECENCCDGGNCNCSAPNERLAHGCGPFPIRLLPL